MKFNYFLIFLLLISCQRRQPPAKPTQRDTVSLTPAAEPTVRHLIRDTTLSDGRRIIAWYPRPDQIGVDVWAEGKKYSIYFPGNYPIWADPKATLRKDISLYCVKNDSISETKFICLNDSTFLFPVCDDWHRLNLAGVVFPKDKKLRLLGQKGDLLLDGFPRGRVIFNATSKKFLITTRRINENASGNQGYEDYIEVYKVNDKGYVKLSEHNLSALKELPELFHNEQELHDFIRKVSKKFGR